MSEWSSTGGRRVLAAGWTIGWAIKSQSGSHHMLSRKGRAEFVPALHELLPRIANRKGLRTEDLHADQPANRGLAFIW